ncbi:MAG: type II secretion system protein [Bacteriovoracaceae bacterium]|nr:type II secretion system protein [Bacteriovoracaceae bacterium]
MQKRNNGFTITEILVTLFIICGLGIFVTVIFSSSSIFKNVNQAKISNTYDIQRVIGRTVATLKLWSGNVNELEDIYASFLMGDGQTFEFFSGDSALNNIVGSKIIKNCSFTSSVSSINFCLFSTNNTAQKLDDAMISARVIHFKINFLDMRDGSQISTDKFAQSIVSGGRADYFLHTWTKTGNKHIQTTIKGVFSFAR